MVRIAFFVCTSRLLYDYDNNLELILNGSQINKHLKKFVSENAQEEFGCKEIAAICKINYNNAFRVLETGIRNGDFDPLLSKYRARISK